MANYYPFDCFSVSIHFAVIFQTKEKGCHSSVVIWFSLVVSFHFFLFLSFVFSRCLPLIITCITLCDYFLRGKNFPLFYFRFSLTFDSLTSRFRSCAIERFITYSFSIQFSLIFSRLTIAGFNPCTFSIRDFPSFPSFFEWFREEKEERKSEVIFFSFTPPLYIWFFFVVKVEWFFQGKNKFFCEEKILTNCWE